MSYSPLTGLVYIPTMEQWMVESRVAEGQFKFVLGQTTLGAGVNNYPELRKQLNAEAESRDKGYMLAWDPVHQREAFRIPYPHPGNGGILTTAGNLLVRAPSTGLSRSIVPTMARSSGRCRSKAFRWRVP